MSDNGRRCSGCGLPPRISSETDTPLPLKRCSLCKNAWYHDVKCQKRHHPVHKEQCKKHRALAQVSSGNGRSSCYRIEHRGESRGRCMIASRHISLGEPIAENEFFDPLVAPVLNIDQRWNRCSLCFRQIDDSSRLLFDDVAHNPCYDVCFCSHQCRERADLISLLDEERAVAAVCSSLKHSQPVMPTVILLYRILFKIAAEEATPKIATKTPGEPTSTSSRIADLQPNDETKCTSFSNSSEEQLHAHAVVIFVAELLLFTSKQCYSLPEYSRKKLAAFSAEYITGVLAKVKTNGFSVCDGESVAMGLGLFPIASNINHSCAPNAIQTFMYSESDRLPRLRISACSDIQANQEVCISYIDCTCPRDIRRENLIKNYSFWCACSACSDDERDAIVEGLRCQKDGCRGRGVRRSVSGGNTAWMCDVCSATDFQSPQELIRKYDSNRLCLAGNFQDSKSRNECRNRAQTIYEELKSTCYPSSYYVRSAGEKLVQSYLHSLTDVQSEIEMRNLCNGALVFAEEILSHYNSHDTAGWTILNKTILRYKVAKLRLFLAPNPLQAIQELQDVYEKLSLFFPRNHEMMEELRRCLEQSGVA